MTDPPIEEFQVTPEGQKYLDDLRDRLLKLAEESPDVDYDPKLRRGGAGGRCETDTFRGKTYCKHSIVKLKKLASVSGSLYIASLQGSYSTSTLTSANTHGGGGAGDVPHWNWTETQDNWVMNLARDICLLVYWDRDAISGVWADHGHWIDPHCPNLSPEAAAQVVDFYWNRNGLANDGPDFGSRKSVAKIWDAYKNRSTTTVAKIEALMGLTTPEEEDMPLNDADKAWIEGAITRKVEDFFETEYSNELIFQKHKTFRNLGALDPDAAARVSASFVMENRMLDRRISRTGQTPDTTIQEIANILTTAKALASELARVSGKTNEQDDLLRTLLESTARIEDALPKAAGA
jgi:hypothetical protein